MTFPIPSRYDTKLAAMEPNEHNLTAMVQAGKRAAQFKKGESVCARGDDGVERWGTAADKVPEKGLLLSGAVGTGKSSIMGALARSVSDAGFSVAWVRWAQLCLLAAEKTPDAREKRGVLGSAAALFVDELGQTEPLPHVAGFVLDIIEARYGERLPLFATTNATEEELARCAGAALVSRLLEMTEPIVVGGPDRRRPT